MIKDCKPHITVACVVQKHGKFLLVEEGSDDQTVFNQPAGHLENDETLIEAAKRETLEETAWNVEISHFIGLSQYQAPNGITYVRVSFAATPQTFDSLVNRDPDIKEIHWKSLDEIHKERHRLRSPLVLNDINRYLNGNLHSLTLIDGFLSP